MDALKRCANRLKMVQRARELEREGRYREADTMDGMVRLASALRVVTSIEAFKPQGWEKSLSDSGLMAQTAAGGEQALNSINVRGRQVAIPGASSPLSTGYEHGQILPQYNNPYDQDKDPKDYYDYLNEYIKAWGERAPATEQEEGDRERALEQYTGLDLTSGRNGPGGNWSVPGSTPAMSYTPANYTAGMSPANSAYNANNGPYAPPATPDSNGNTAAYYGAPVAPSDPNARQTYAKTRRGNRFAKSTIHSALRQVKAVASSIEHSGDYGNCCFNAAEGKVWWNMGDADGMDGLATSDEIRARFLAVPGVKKVEITDEAPTRKYDNKPGWVKVQ